MLTHFQILRLIPASLLFIIVVIIVVKFITEIWEHGRDFTSVRYVDGYAG